LLYDMEDRTQGLSFEQRGALRAAESRPLVDRLFARWQEVRPGLRPTSKLAEAIGYALNRRVELFRCLDDGRIELDTGHLERSLRPVAIGRKNYLFYGSLSGGRTAAALYSVVQSARHHHLDVTAYLTDALRRLPALLPSDATAIGAFLPDRWAQTHPEHVLAARANESREATEHRRQRRAARRLLSQA
jgi:transposase